MTKGFCMFKLLVLDVDDTIITARDKLTSASKEAIKEAQRRGIQVALASGRMHQAMKRLASELDIKLPLISCNGAMVKRLDGVAIAKETLDAGAALDVVAYFREKRRVMQLYKEEGLFSVEKCERTWRLEEREGVPCTIIGWESYASRHDDLLKLLIRLEPDEVEDCRMDVERLFGRRVNAALSHNVYLEFTNKGVDKGRAVALLAQKLGIRREEVMAVGDSPNDMSMLAWAGYGVAMGNALPEVKEVADALTLSVEEDGAALAIEKYIFNNGVG